MSAHRVAALLSTMAVVVAVAGGVWLIGTPSEQRTLRFDERRVADLKQLSYSVNYHWTQRHELPARAEEAVDGRILSRLPLDPESKRPYDYRVTGERTFELCATFTRRSREEAGDFWFHDAGSRCYSFDVPKSFN
jgi:hypothetical protein